MNSTFFGINIGLRGLQAQQKGLEVSSHNIANANSPGYTRQRAVMQASTPFPVPALNRPVGPGQLGTGVEVAMIDRIRDAFLDGQIRSETASLGRWEERSKALEQAEIVFMEPGETGLATLLDQFWNSWQELSKYPESAPVRTTLVETATSLAEALRHTHTQLEQIQEDIDTSMRILVDQVNTLARQIAALNQQIVAVKLAGDQPNDLLDQRDKLLDELSGVVDYKLTENGDGSVTITVGAGTEQEGNLVEGNTAKEIKAFTDTADNDRLKVSWQDLDPPVAFNWGDLGGRFLGMHEARDVLVQGYIDDLNALAQTLAENVNTIHQEGLGLEATPQSRPFFESNVAGADIDASNIIVNHELEADPIRVAASGVHVTLDPAIGSDGVAGTEIDPGAEYRIYFEADAEGSTVTLQKMSDGDWTDVGSAVNWPSDGEQLTVGNTDSKETISFRPASVQPSEGEYAVSFYSIPGDGTNALAIAQLQNTPVTIDDSGTYTIDDYYRNLVAGLGVEAHEANRMVENQGVLVDQLTNRKESLSGVSLDEEMANLVQFQRAYEAAARVITTMDSLLDTLINRMAV